MLDSVGGKNLVDGIDALAYRGTIVSVGVAGRAGSTIEASSLWTKNNTLRGVYLGGALLAEYPRVHQMIGDLIEPGGSWRTARRDRQVLPALRGGRSSCVPGGPDGLRPGGDDAVTGEPRLQKPPARYSSPEPLGRPAFRVLSGPRPGRTRGPTIPRPGPT